MSIKKDKPIVQDSKSLAEVAQKFVPSTEIKHFYDEEIANYEKTNPFWNSISANRIFDMHVLMDQTRLWKNSAYHKIEARTDINIERNKHKRSDNDEMRHSVSYQQVTPLLSWCS